MSQVVRSIAGLLAVLSFVGHSTATVRADYPDAAPGGPVQPGPRDRPATTLKPLDSGGSLRPIATGAAAAAPRKFPIRFPSGERQAGAPAELTPDGAGAPQRLVAHQHAIPLARPSAESVARRQATDRSPWLTGAASLGIVVGLFLLVVWSVRRGMPKTPMRLPREAVEILGRAPLVGRQQVHLVRCGNKVLLLSVSATSVETLTEITDPEEVDRLAEICQNAGPQGVSASIRQVFQQFGRPSGLDYFSDRGTDELDFGHLEAEIGHRAREARV